MLLDQTSHITIPWLILGGGLHGVHMAVSLVEELGIPSTDIIILDREDELLGQWKWRTSRTGMTHLRSPSVHHLAPNPHSLKKYETKRQFMEHPSFIPPYNRPSLELFNTHSEQTIKSYGLQERHLKASAEDIEIEDSLFKITTSKGHNIICHKLILALGMESSLCFPTWAPKNSPSFKHIFQKDPLEVSPQGIEKIVVVGGGITAAQTALHYANPSREIQLISRQDLQVQQFDSDPGWLGPKYMNDFSKVKCLQKRRSIIRKARHKGTMPSNVKRALKEAENQGLVRVMTEKIIDVEYRADEVSISLNGGETLKADLVILATGFENDSPGGSLIDNLIKKYNLPCAPCGYPKTDSHLRWHSELYVMGPLAELELGPVSRNIAGARRAAEKIVDAEKNRISQGLTLMQA